MSTIHERLREERLRLKMSQEAFGAAGGVRKQAQINYEKGVRRPDAGYLERIAAIGANVDYILTGTTMQLRDKLNNIRATVEAARLLTDDKEQAAEYQSLLFQAMEKARGFKADEEQLIEYFRRCSREDQQQIAKLAKRLSES